ncbi:UNKNOWN [Stylonychia lemnae]|uniref:Uncharacterized protein n=1 Tax=Stylonychia lemnae TaxID=5949 RepID=A0A078AQQ9_STYLE|nr:UNKNOWN [Stylonychia lemnae]|eukprot:CDW84261.1 UNKNOWN [Stylonychia lemnae]
MKLFVVLIAFLCHLKIIEGFGDSTGSTFADVIDIDGNLNIISGGETRVTTHGLSQASGYYTYFQYVSYNGQSDWVRIYNQVAFTEVLNLVFQNGVTQASRAAALISNPTSLILHIILISTTDGSLINAFYDDSVAGGAYWSYTYLNSVILDASNNLYFGGYTGTGRTMIAKFDLTSTTSPNVAKWKFDHKGAFTWADSGQVGAIYLEPTNTYLYSSVRYYKTYTNPTRNEYFPTVQRMSTITGTLQYAYSINITRVQTIDIQVQRSIAVQRSGTQDNIFGCQPIVYTKVTPNEIRFTFYRLVVNADYTIASQVFVEILEQPRCLDLRVQSVTSFYVLALEFTPLYKNHLIRIYDITSAGASMTRQEFTYTSNYRIYDGVILPDYTVYYNGATLYTKLSGTRYFTYIILSLLLEL